jgi:RNA polymerase sigma-70 factor (ECF subfamily)
VRQDAGVTTTDLIGRARAGDGDAFGELIGPYERELRVHCYRMLGSVQDAEDALQDALLAAWQGLARFEGRASIRTWLYRVATTRCLNALRSARRRPAVSPPPGLSAPGPTRLGEVVWLEPYPDLLLGERPDSAPGPEARYEAREAISLAFITAVQRLPPRQRAVLILRDVLGFAASEAARVLDTTEESVTSALKRARATLRAGREAGRADELPPPEPGSAGEKRLVEQLTRAYETGDVDAIVALFTDDAWLTMPPMALEYQGRELIGRFLAAIAFRDGRTYRLVATRGNGQLSFGSYLREPGGGMAQANDILVLTLTGSRISAMTRFQPSLLARFGLPASRPELAHRPVCGPAGVYSVECAPQRRRGTHDTEHVRPGGHWRLHEADPVQCAPGQGVRRADHRVRPGVLVGAGHRLGRCRRRIAVRLRGGADTGGSRSGGQPPVDGGLAGRVVQRAARLGRDIPGLYGQAVGRGRLGAGVPARGPGTATGVL